MPEMEDGALVIDDVSHYETEKLIEIFKPDVLCAGIKEKYVVQKHGVPLKQLHSYDYGGPYAGFEGAINFRITSYNVCYTKLLRCVSKWGLSIVSFSSPYFVSPVLIIHIEKMLR